MEEKREIAQDELAEANQFLDTETPKTPETTEDELAEQKAKEREEAKQAFIAEMKRLEEILKTEVAQVIATETWVVFRPMKRLVAPGGFVPSTGVSTLPVGEVVSAGPGRLLLDGAREPLPYRAGDHVLILAPPAEIILNNEVFGILDAGSCGPVIKGLKRETFKIGKSVDDYAEAFEAQRKLEEGGHLIHRPGARPHIKSLQ